MKLEEDRYMLIRGFLQQNSRILSWIQSDWLLATLTLILHQVYISCIFCFIVFILIYKYYFFSQFSVDRICLPNQPSCYHAVNEIRSIKYHLRLSKYFKEVLVFTSDEIFGCKKKLIKDQNTLFCEIFCLLFFVTETSWTLLLQRKN